MHVRPKRVRPLVAMALLAVLFQAGCRIVYSVHALFADRDLVLDAGLVGNWTQASDPRADHWVVLRPDTNSRSYLLAIAGRAVAAALGRADFPGLMASDSSMRARLRRDPAARARRARDSVTVAPLASDSVGPRLFEVRLGQLGGASFLDISPTSIGGAARLGNNLQIPGHWFWRASLDTDRLRLTPLDEDWLAQMVDSGKVTIAHETEGSTIILTAPTGDLQRLVTQYSQDTLAFPRRGTLEFRRRPVSVPQRSQSQ